MTLATLPAPDEPACRLHESADDTVSRLLDDAGRLIAAAQVMRSRQCPLLADDLRRSALAKIHEANELIQREATTEGR
jgi:hypothetical protein